MSTSSTISTHNPEPVFWGPRLTLQTLHTPEEGEGRKRISKNLIHVVNVSVGRILTFMCPNIGHHKLAGVMVSSIEATIAKCSVDDMSNRVFQIFSHLGGVAILQDTPDLGTATLDYEALNRKVRDWENWVYRLKLEYDRMMVGVLKLVEGDPGKPTDQICYLDNTFEEFLTWCNWSGNVNIKPCVTPNGNVVYTIMSKMGGFILGAAAPPNDCQVESIIDVPILMRNWALVNRGATLPLTEDGKIDLEKLFTSPAY